MTLLKNENLLQHFKIVCVDNILDTLPPDMKVPLMRLYNVPEPFQAQAIYNWISQIKLRKSGNSQVQDKTSPKGPRGFDNDVMSKISDQFAFSDPTINDPMPQSYFGINQEANNAIFTPPKDAIKIKKDEQKTILKDIEERRAQQNNEFTQNNKQRQMESMICNNYEHRKQNPQIAVMTSVQPQPKKGITLVKH